MIKKIISKHDFYFETPLYDEIKYSELENISELLKGDVDAYSVKNKSETTYELNKDLIVDLEKKGMSVEGGITYIHREFDVISLECKRKRNDVLFFFILDDQINKIIMKVGQAPSIADLQFSDIERKYTKMLEDNYLQEFKKAIVSASHGYGVASFIYLRRIFESLVFETYTAYKNELGIDFEEFKKLQMEKKIIALKKYLPSQLVEMKSIYGIFGKGIHELDENECLSYFGPLKLSIELILDQRIDEKKKLDKDAEVKKQIQHITSALSQKYK